mgnify:CR=1 FL=1
MNYETLKASVCAANKEISRTGLAVLTWGNASEVDRESGVFAIKPSGVDYAELTPADIVIVSLETGKKVEGKLNPSSDTPTHWWLFNRFRRLAELFIRTRLKRQHGRRRSGGFRSLEPRMRTIFTAKCPAPAS